MLRSLCIDAVKVFLMQTFRNTGSMNNVVEGVARQLLSQLFLRRKVQFYEMDALVLQESLRT